MRTLTIISILFFLCFVCHAYAQDITMQNLSAQNAALALCNGSNDREWSTITNPAGLSDISTISFATAYQSLFMGVGLSQKAFTASLPYEKHTFGLNILQQGDKHFHTNLFSLNYAQNITEKIAAGIRFSYQNFLFPEDGKSPGTYSISLGGKTKVYDFFIGIYCNNLVRGKVKSVFTSLQSTTLTTVNITYPLSENLNLFGTGYTQNWSTVNYAIGAEICAKKQLFFRAGLFTQNMSITGGLGYAFKQYKIDVATSYHQTLGASPVFSLQYKLPRKTLLR